MIILVYRMVSRSLLSRCINPLMHSVPFFFFFFFFLTLANSADSNQMPQNAASDQGIQCLLTGITIYNEIEMKKYNRINPLNEKLTRPVNKCGTVS